MSGLLIIMAKEPSLGTVKTRLSPPLSPQECVALYTAFLRDTISLVEEACRLSKDVAPALAYTPTSAHRFFRGLAPGHFIFLAQKGAGLGERLCNLPVQARNLGHSPIVMISSDSPTLPPDIVVRCFTELRRPEVDVVLGPCDDGGYYLIGMKRPQPALFAGIAWSTEQVTGQTLRAARKAALRVSLLPTWPDVDTAEDLSALWTELQSNMQAAPHTRDALSVMQLELTA